MAGVGEALAVVGLLHPAFKGCFEAYGCYKLTKNFGEDFQKAERSLRGQMARLKLLSDTKITDLMSIPQEGTQLANTVKWTLQEMRKNFERCEMLMKKHGEPEASRRNPAKLALANLQTMYSGSSKSPASSTLSPTESSNGKKSMSSLFPRRHKTVISTTSTGTPSRADSRSANISSATASTPASTIGSLYDAKITEGIQEDALRAKALQSSSSFIGRLKWAADDRSQFFSAIEELARANDLLESLLRIRSPEDECFLVTVPDINRDVQESIMKVRSTLEALHKELLATNPQGRAIEYCLKLALNDRDKETYADYVDTEFGESSAVYSLQAHVKSKHNSASRSFYLLAETGIPEGTEVPTLSNVVESLASIDEDSDPVFQCLSKATDNAVPARKLRIYQDRTTEWVQTHTLATALQNQAYQDICFQRHYIQLGLFMAFSYAALPFAFKGKTKFPQPSNYTYYDHFSGEDVNVSNDSNQGSGREEAAEDTGDISGADDRPSISSTTIEESFQELQSPYINFNFGSRPRNINTKALGKRPGFVASTDNPVVSLGLLLYQIGSWQQMPANDIMQMRRDALDRSHDLIRLSGVEFADITRTCLNWKERERSGDGKKMDSDAMLVKIYTRLDEYNKELQDL
ncbi:hypothetical protein BKA61DRAFT_595567, partial [Leptodontidium sp. MPI-SDFR-AT-0119]